MRRVIFSAILLFQCLLATASAGVLVLDLDNEVNANLLSSSEYYLDDKANPSFYSTANLPNSAWKRFDRDQLKFGFTDRPVWLKTTFRTTGKHPREVALTLHKVLNNITMRMTKKGASDSVDTVKATRLLYSFNKDINATEKSSSNLNNTKVTLEPGHTYQLLVQINSTSPVIGEFMAIEPIALEKVTAEMDQWVTIAMILIFLVSIYNAIIFISSKHPAIIAHLIYVLSILGYLLNDFGYIEKWTALSQLETVQRLSAVFLVTSILSLIAFFKLMSNQKMYGQFFRRIYQVLFLAGYTLITVMFLIPFQYVLHLILILIGLSITVGMISALISWKEKRQTGDDDNSLSLTLLIVLATLVPSVTIHLLSRRGIIDVKWYTESALFAAIIVEVLLFSVILFLNIRKRNEAYQHELYTNNLSGLPNSRALEKFFVTEPSPNNKTIIQIWISGLDELQVAFGPELYKAFLFDTTKNLSQGLLEIPNVAKYIHNDKSTAALFHSDKNTFTLLCTKLDKPSRIAIEGQLNHALETMSPLHHNSIDLKVVLGAYEFDHSKTQLNDALVNCNLALAYSIKHNKKLKFYTPQMSFDERQRLALVNGFHHSLDNQEFFILLQPQYDTQTSKIIGAEVLSRWQHEQYGLINPDLFIPLLEQSNRICELSHWVIDEVLKQLPLLHEHYPGIEISINLSPRDLIGDGLIEFLDKKLASHASLTPFITFEITETLLIDDYSQVLKNIERLQSRGFNVSIDDFGSGYTSFAYLQKLPADELKIDKSYTDSYLESSSNAILESMIFMAKRLNMRIVVEGIENQQQIDLFKRLGVERLQGWMLDKPMSINALVNKNIALS